MGVWFIKIHVMKIFRKNVNVLLLFVGQLLFFNCSSDKSESPTDDGPPIEETFLTQQELQALSVAGMDASHFENMGKAVERNDYPNIHSILVVKDNELVFERYFPGNDENWGYNLGRVNHTAQTLHDVRSITKSVVATCIGIAIDQGLIQSEDQNIFDFFPNYQEYKTGLRAQITIEDLLIMAAGMQWDETTIPYTNPANPEIQMTNSQDPINFVLSVPVDTAPGQEFIYNGGATQLLAGIVAHVSGMQVDAFAEQHLFGPLGIDNFVWHSYTASDIPAAASGLRLTSRDLMKFGLLYQNEGLWEGERILSVSWVQDAFIKHIDKPLINNAFFGYHFHMPPPFQVRGQTIDYVSAIGNGDQRIFFDKANNLLVITTAGNYNTYIPNNSVALMKNFIYPSFL